MPIIVFKYGSLLPGETFVRSHIDRIAGGYNRFMHLDEWRTPMLGRRRLWRTNTASELLRRARIKAGYDRTQLHAEAFARGLKRSRASAVLAEFGYSGTHIWSVCRRLGIPLVIQFHGTDVNRRDLVEKHISAYRQMFEYSAGLVAVSDHDRRRLVEMGAPPSKTHVIPCGATLPDHLHDGERSTREYNIIGVGRFAPVKAPQLTLLAFHRYLAMGGMGRLHMIGDGPLLPFCETLGRGLGIENQVTFHGALPHEQVLDLLSRSHLYVQHSVTAPDGDCEGMPVSIMEAAGYGLPIVATRTGGIPEMIEHGRNGYLVEQYDVDAMAQHMYELWRDAEHAEALGRNARAKAEVEYDVERQCGKLKDLVLSISNPSREA